MRKIFFGLFLLFALSFNAKADNLSIGVVDLMRLNKESSVVKSLNKQKDAAIVKITEAVQTKRKELEKKENDLKSKQALMNKDAFIKEVQMFQQDMMKFDAGTQQKLSDVEKAYVTALQKIQRDYLDRIITKLGKEKKFSLVINGQAAVVLDSKLDITSEVIAALNDEVKEIKLDIK